MNEWWNQTNGQPSEPSAEQPTVPEGQETVPQTVAPQAAEEMPSWRQITPTETAAAPRQTPAVAVPPPVPSVPPYPASVKAKDTEDGENAASAAASEAAPAADQGSLPSGLLTGAPEKPPIQPPAPQQPAYPPVQPSAYPPVYRPPYPPAYSWSAPPMPSTPPVQTPSPKKKRHTGVLIGILAGVCAGAVLTLCIMMALSFGDGLWRTSPSSSSSQVSGNSNGTSQTTPTGNPNAPTLNVTPSDGTELALTQLVQNNMDSTVVLSMYMKDNTGTEQEVGGASGIIASADGYIITNRHCVIDEDVSPEQAFDRIEVTLYDGTVYHSVTVVGTDYFTDLAVIKVDATDLKPVTFGDSDALQIGQDLAAIGNAGGLGWTVTRGILSGRGRAIYDNSEYGIKCLQTDTAINPGNSGGPLFNMAGQVIGINSAKLVASGYEGLGFAIPINEALPILNDLMQYGYVPGRLLLSIQGQSYDDGTVQGIQIVAINSDSVFVGTQAAVGDVITQIGDTKVASASDITAVLKNCTAGQQVTVTLVHFIRGGSSNTFTVTVTLKEIRSN
ncbi:MAG: trypsin-like peptidase domain-containing protein [Oscillospiraceae bacterium]|nr:trypsin-like peptidase domain-containing protein [Oscillospiraceae bacterium]